MHALRYLTQHVDPRVQALVTTMQTPAPTNNQNTTFNRLLEIARRIVTSGSTLASLTGSAAQISTAGDSRASDQRKRIFDDTSILSIFDEQPVHSPSEHSVGQSS